MLFTVNYSSFPVSQIIELKKWPLSAEIELFNFVGTTGFDI